MKQKIFVIEDEKVLSNLVAFIKARETLVEVVVRDHKKDRSVLQNSLYWFWLTIIADELGSTKEDIHHDYKYRILCRIYERDDAGYAEMINSIRKVRKMGFFNEHKSLVENIVKLTSTTTATVPQFAEYLTEIERDCIDKGITLPHPEDRYIDALMIPAQ